MNKKIILIAAVVVTLGGGGAGIWFFMPELLPEFIRPGQGGQGKQAKQEEKKHEPEVTVDLDTFVVNLAGPGLGRYFRTSLSVAVRSEHDKEAIKEFIAPVRHAVIMYLTARKVEDLVDPEGKKKMRDEVLKLVNSAIGKKMVHNVYFKEFLIQ
jgi:flagellar FliL protein